MSADKTLDLASIRARLKDATGRRYWQSLEELADTDQAYEADVVQGVEDAGDHPEKEVHSHEDPDYRREDDIPPENVA